MAKYPWNKWLERAAEKKLKLSRGKHYDCLSYVMAQNIRNYLCRHPEYRKLRASIKIEADYLTVELVSKRRRSK